MAKRRQADARRVCLETTAMRLNHLDLAVPDIAAARDFFETHLGFTHQQTLGQNGLSILRDEGGLTLVLSRLQRRGARAYPDGFHIGFHLESEAAVHALYDRMTGAGVDIHDPPTVQHGALGFYFTAPGDILVEVAYRA
jgi:catechol 2,3-dioxygenase-like lactoylglutathione lyase family enzyme